MGNGEDSVARKGVTSRIFRPGQPVPADGDWLCVSVDERADVERLDELGRKGGRPGPR
jgi:hypothetical protein